MSDQLNVLKINKKTRILDNFSILYSYIYEFMRIALVLHIIYLIIDIVINNRPIGSNKCRSLFIISQKHFTLDKINVH